MGAKFIPLILSSGGGMSQQTNDFIKVISMKIAGTSGDEMKISQQIKIDISTSLMRSRLQSVRGAKSQELSRTIQLTHSLVDI